MSEIDVERLARAMYEDRQRAFRRERRPSWNEMVAAPHAPHDPRRPANATNESVLTGWRDNARAVVAIYARLKENGS